MTPQSRLTIMLLILLAGGLKLAIGDDDSPETRRPPALTVPPPQTESTLRAEAPAESQQARRRPMPQLPSARVEHKGAQDSTGTAWPVGADGLWVTARHVAQGCKRIFIERPGGWIEARRAANHPNADLALLRANDSPQPIPLADMAARAGADGFGFGYPAFKPIALYGQKLGEARLVGRGAFRTDETTAVWVERRRYPDRSGSLGGVSGGPMLDSQGRVIGVLIAEQPRRGRVDTAMLPTLHTMLGAMPARAEEAAKSGPSRWGPIAPSSLPEIDKRIRERGAVSRVLCTTGRGKQPRGMKCGRRNPMCA